MWTLHKRFNDLEIQARWSGINCLVVVPKVAANYRIIRMFYSYFIYESAGFDDSPLRGSSGWLILPGSCLV